MVDKTPTLLALLQATVDDQKLFDMSGVTDPREFKAELREARARAGALSQRDLLLGGDILSGVGELRDPDFPGRS